MSGFTLILQINKLGLNSENSKYLGEVINQLPKNLKNFTLNLYRNNLGENTQNL